MYYYTTTIDEAGMLEVMTDSVERINAPLKKAHPFQIVRTEEPLEAEKLPVPLSTFHLAIDGDMPPMKSAIQVNAFVAALADAVQEVMRLNESNYIVVKQARRPQPGR